MRFPKLVIDEATKLKEYATKEEIEKLDFDNLMPNDYAHCIYGQMTGDCFNERSTELIEKCASKVYDNTGCEGPAHEGVKLNGSPKNTVRHKYFSPIEVFISAHPSKSGAGKLIQFLKGEIDSLVD